MGAGTWTDDGRQTVGEYLDKWLARKAAGLKPTTVDTYRSHIELHIRPELGRLKLRDLRPEHIYAMLQVVAEGRSVAMVHRVRATLRTALAALFHLVAYLGLRRGEALGLRWDDVDLVRRRVVIR